MTEEDGWDLAERLQREMDQRGISKRSIETGSGVSGHTLNKLLAGQPIARQDRLAVLARHLGWRGDAFELIRRGEEPEPLIDMGASGANLAELAEIDPDYHAQLDELARKYLEQRRP